MRFIMSHRGKIGLVLAKNERGGVGGGIKKEYPEVVLPSGDTEYKLLSQKKQE